MLTSLQRWFSVDTILPMKDRLGPVDTTKNLYSKKKKKKKKNYIINT